MSAAIMVFVFLLGLGPRQKNTTYDSKIDENRCKQKNEPRGLFKYECK